MNRPRLLANLPFVMSLFLFGPAHAKVDAPCEKLYQISKANRKALRAINGSAMRSIVGTNAGNKQYEDLNAVMDANQWPFTSSTTDDGVYIFKSADFDGDGKGDNLREECGAPSWRRICTLFLDNGGTKPIELEEGWMYVTRLNQRFYVVMDWYGAEGGGGGFPEKDLSHYYRVASHGFFAICNGK